MTWQPGCRGSSSLPSTPQVAQPAAALAPTTRAKGMEEAKAEPELAQPPPVPRNRHPAAAPGSRPVPVVVHAGGRPLSSFQFVFYQPGWPNSLAPFCTAQKPFCGFLFQPGAAHGRRRLDVPGCDPSKWRCCHGPKP